MQKNIVRMVYLDVRSLEIIIVIRIDRFKCAPTDSDERMIGNHRKRTDPNTDPKSE